MGVLLLNNYETTYKKSRYISCHCGYCCFNRAYRGSQIDMLIDRSDNVISVCEIKYSRNEYEITKADAENFMNKIDKLISHTKTKKSIRFTMVTLNGLKQNKYVDIVQNQIDIKNIISL